MKIKNTLTMVAASIFASIGLSVASIDIDTVLVGNPGNAGDTAVMLSDGTTGYGSVAYEYRIGTTEVTNAQYVAFLNDVAKSDPLGLYNSKMADYGSGSSSDGSGIIRSGVDGSYTYSVVAGRENYAVNYVSLFDAARFCNWVTSGKIDVGVYTIIDPSSQYAGDGSITRDNDAWLAGGIALPTEDEWYKAAYYNKDADDGSYYNYPTSNDSIDPGDANYWDTGIKDITNVDFGVGSPYGTFGQGGNVWEWNETVVETYYYRLRGASFWTRGQALQNAGRYGSLYAPDRDDFDASFRIVVGVPIVVPEPSTYAAIFGALALGFVVYCRRSIAPKK